MRKAQQTRSLVAAWFDFLPPAEMPVAQAIHKTVRATVADLTEAVRQGNLLLSMNGEPLLAIAPGRGQVSLLIFNGSDRCRFPARARWTSRASRPSRA